MTFNPREVTIFSTFSLSLDVSENRHYSFKGEVGHSRTINSTAIYLFSDPSASDQTLINVFGASSGTEMTNYLTRQSERKNDK